MCRKVREPKTPFRIRSASRQESCSDSRPRRSKRDIITEQKAWPITTAPTAFWTRWEILRTLKSSKPSPRLTGSRSEWKGSTLGSILTLNQSNLSISRSMWWTTNLQHATKRSCISINQAYGRVVLPSRPIRIGKSTLVYSSLDWRKYQSLSRTGSQNRISRFRNLPSKEKRNR